MINTGKNLDLAILNLKKNNIVAIPTETVYGLGANALSKKAVNKLFKLKKRPQNDPLICHTNSIEKISQYVKKIPRKAKLLNDLYWPGPLTILFEKKNIIPDITTSLPPLNEEITGLLRTIVISVSCFHRSPLSSAS